LATPYSLAAARGIEAASKSGAIAGLLQCQGESEKTVIAEGEKEEAQREGQPSERLDVPEQSQARVRHDS